MTEVQINEAARKLCELRGLNPDETIIGASGDLDVCLMKPRWLTVVDEIRQALLIQEAIEFAKQS